jgi:hypothetical protein
MGADLVPKLYSLHRLRRRENEDRQGRYLLSLFRKASRMAQTWANPSAIDAGFYGFLST